MPPQLLINVAGRLWQFRPQQTVHRPPHRFFLGPAIECLGAAIPKNNSAAAETTYENRIVALKQGSFSDHFRSEIIFINPLMVFGYDQLQLACTSRSIFHFAKTLLENINESQFIIGFFVLPFEL